MHHKAAPRDDGIVVTPPLPTSSVIIETFIPFNMSAVVVLSSVVRAYRDVLRIRAREFNEDKLFGAAPSQSCENNIKCFESYDAEKQAGEIDFQG